MNQKNNMVKNCEEEQTFVTLVDNSFQNNEIDQYSYVFKKDFDERIIYIDSTIEPETMIAYTRQILYYNREDRNIPEEERKPIKIFIYSDGGDVMAMWHFVDICQLSKTPIYTYNIGCAMSAGLTILVSGKKRYALANSTALCHKGSFSGVMGDMAAVQASINLGGNKIKKIFDFIIQKTKITKKMIDKKTVTDWYIEGEEQLELGIVDEIISNIDDLL